VTAELRLGLGLEVNRKRVERLMCEHGIQGIYRRKGRKNLVNAATEEDLLNGWNAGITHTEGIPASECSAQPSTSGAIRSPQTPPGDPTPQVSGLRGNLNLTNMVPRGRLPSNPLAPG